MAQKLKVAFISLNKEDMPAPVVPLGLLYVMGTLDDEHYEKELWDFCFIEDIYSFLTEKIEAFKPDVVALGIRNLQNNNYSGISTNIAYYKNVVDFLRKNLRKGTPLIVGGSGFSVIPEELLNYLKVDFGIAGEGEVLFPQLIRALEEKRKDFNHLGGLYLYRDGQVLKAEQDQGFLDFSQSMAPNRAILGESYYRVTGTENIQTKRGCAFKCSYCTYPKIEGRVYRLRSPESVVLEMTERAKQEKCISNFFIVDSVFNRPLDHAKEICRELIKQEFSHPWCCYINPLGFDLELAHLLVSSGCAGIEVGVDSGDDETLKRLKKGFTTKTVTQLREYCEKAGLKDCHTLILGTPGETLETVKRSLQFIEELNPHAVILMVWKDDDETFNGALQKERHSLREEILGLVLEYSKNNPHWTVPQLELNFTPKLFHFMRRRGFKDPLWTHLPRKERLC